MPPVVHLTDFYSPPQDPDDALDLATLHALPELDVRAVVLDCTRRFLRGAGEGGADVHRDPALLSVLQLQHLTGTAYPVALGPVDPLAAEEDDCRDRAPAEQAGVELLLRTLRDATEPVLVTVVSSLRPLAAALNRDPGLCRERIGRVVLNAGTRLGEDGGPEQEWNVLLDRYAWRRVWRSGLPIDWYPCAGPRGSFSVEEGTTFWSAPHEQLFAGLPTPLLAWFHLAFSAAVRPDLFRALGELGAAEPWRLHLHDRRNVWSTASLVGAAGRELQETPQGWRFVPGAPAGTHLLDPVAVRLDGDRVLEAAGSPAGARAHRRVLPEGPGHVYGTRMTEALGALLREQRIGTPVH